MPQLLVGHTTGMYNYVVGGFEEKKEKDKKKEAWQQLLAQVPIFKKKKLGAGPVTQRLSSHILLWQPGVRWFRSRVWTRHCSASHAVVDVPHIQ